MSPTQKYNARANIFQYNHTRHPHSFCLTPTHPHKPACNLEVTHEDAHPLAHPHSHTHTHIHTHIQQPPPIHTGEGAGGGRSRVGPWLLFYCSSSRSSSNYVAACCSILGVHHHLHHLQSCQERTVSARRGFLHTISTACNHARNVR